MRTPAKLELRLDKEQPEIAAGPPFVGRLLPSQAGK